MGRQAAVIRKAGSLLPLLVMLMLLCWTLQRSTAVDGVVAVGYGSLSFICTPLFWLLDHLYRLTGNWGAAIVLLTLIVKAALWRLDLAQHRTVAKAPIVQPQVDALAARYQGDPEGKLKALLALYRREDYHPFASLAAALVVIPVIVALATVLVRTPELRQAPLGLWLTDLSAPDPSFVLPVLFGIVDCAGHWLAPRRAHDRLQAAIHHAMALAMVALFALLPAGLVLCFLVSSMVSFVQLTIIRRRERPARGALCEDHG